MTLPLRVPYAKYVALPTWNGQHWDVRIEDYDERHRSDTTACRLGQVRFTTRTTLGVLYGYPPSLDMVWVEPILPPEAETALAHAGSQPTPEPAKVATAAAALRDMGLCRHDIALVLSDRGLPDPLPSPVEAGPDPGVFGLHRSQDVASSTCCQPGTVADGVQGMDALVLALVADDDNRCSVCIPAYWAP